LRGDAVSILIGSKQQRKEQAAKSNELVAAKVNGGGSIHIAQCGLVSARLAL
jgi:hypothetical protein